MAGYVASQALRLVSNIILTRLLFPEVFGLASLVFVFTTGLHMFSDVGTGPAIVQSSRGDDPTFLNTAWTIAFLRGLLVFGATCAIAHPVAAFYGQPTLTWVLPAAGLNSVLGGLESTKLQTALRHLRIGRRTLLELTSQVVGSTSTILLAFAYRSLRPGDHLGAIWAIIGGTLAGALTTTVVSHVAFPGVRNRFRLERDAARHLFTFGRWVFASTLLSFLAGQADRLMLGKLLSLQVLGVYGIASNLAGLASMAVDKLGGTVLFPAYSRMAERGGLRRAYQRARLPLLLGGGAIVTGFLSCGPQLVRVIYDGRYAHAGWMLQYLAVGAWLEVLERSNRAALLAQGRVSWMATADLARLASFVALLPLGMKIAGLPGAIVGLVLADVVKYLILTVGVARSGLRGIGQDLLVSAGIAAVSTAGSVVAGALQRAIHTQIAGLLGGGAVVGGASLLVGLWYLKRFRAERAVSVGIAPPVPG
jgi:O-antigen/teichoic acid export membrane protein